MEGESSEKTLPPAVMEVGAACRVVSSGDVQCNNWGPRTRR